MIAKTVQIVSLPDGLAKGWDLADAEDKGWTTEQTLTWIRQHIAPAGPKGLFHLEEASIANWIFTPPPRRRWLIEDVLPLGKVGLLVAPGGTGKSFFTLSVAVAVATGLPAFGSMPIGEQGGVLALFAEEDPEELHRRLFYVINQMITETDNQEYYRQKITERIFAKSMSGQNNLMTHKVRQEVSMTTYVERLIETAKQVPDLKLIIIDPASRFRGGEENSAEDTTRFVEALEVVAKYTKATVLLVHHSNKSSMAGGVPTSQAAARGSSALTDGVRWQGNLSTMSEIEAKTFSINEKQRRDYVRFSITKSNYGPPKEDVWLVRGEQGVLKSVDLVPAGNKKTENLLDKIIKIIEANAAKGVEETKTSFIVLNSGKDSPLAVGKDTVRAILDKALASGDLILRRPTKPTKNVSSVLGLPGEEGHQEADEDPQEEHVLEEF